MRSRRTVIAEWLDTAIRNDRTLGRRGRYESLAQRSNVSRATIWRILEERTDADDTTVHRLAVALKVPNPEFVGPPLASAAMTPGELAEALAEALSHENLLSNKAAAEVVRHQLLDLGARLGRLGFGAASADLIHLALDFEDERMAEHPPSRKKEDE